MEGEYVSEFIFFYFFLTLSPSSGPPPSLYIFCRYTFVVWRANEGLDHMQDYESTEDVPFWTWVEWCAMPYWRQRIELACGVRVGTEAEHAALDKRFAQEEDKYETVSSEDDCPLASLEEVWKNLIKD